LLANINQIPPIGAIAVEKDDQLLRRPRAGRETGAGEGGLRRRCHGCFCEASEARRQAGGGRALQARL